jgi:hypothetical protein
MQKKFIFQDVGDMHHRHELIKDNCDEIVPYSYLKRLTDEELSGLKDDLSENAIALDAIEQEFDAIKKEFKEKTKPYKERIKSLLVFLRDKGISVNENCYVLKDESTYNIYSKEGELLMSRPLKPAETQKTLQMELRKTM